MDFNPINFVSNLKYMGLGMLGILIVMGIIIIATILLEKLTSSKSKQTENDD